MKNQSVTQHRDALNIFIDYNRKLYNRIFFEKYETDKSFIDEVSSIHQTIYLKIKAIKLSYYMHD
jgi:hypothetical protein